MSLSINFESFSCTSWKSLVVRDACIFVGLTVSMCHSHTTCWFITKSPRPALYRAGDATLLYGADQEWMFAVLSRHGGRSGLSLCWAWHWLTALEDQSQRGRVSAVTAQGIQWHIKRRERPPRTSQSELHSNCRGIFSSGVSSSRYKVSERGRLITLEKNVFVGPIESSHFFRLSSISVGGFSY